MQYPKISGLNFMSEEKIQVNLLIDTTLQIHQVIDAPPGDPDTWTIGQIKRLALLAAGSKIPK